MTFHSRLHRKLTSFLKELHDKLLGKDHSISWTDDSEHRNNQTSIVQPAIGQVESTNHFEALTSTVKSIRALWSCFWTTFENTLLTYRSDPWSLSFIACALHPVSTSCCWSCFTEWTHFWKYYYDPSTADSECTEDHFLYSSLQAEWKFHKYA